MSEQESPVIRVKNLEKIYTGGVHAVKGVSFDVLPKKVSDVVRISIERMVIRSYASLIKNKSKVDSIEISSYRLTNDRIDK